MVLYYSQYEGGYKNDRREGHGLFKFANGDWFEGTWFDGKPNGQGKVEYTSGDVYEGHFKDHMKHGFGIFTFATGCQVSVVQYMSSLRVIVLSYILGSTHIDCVTTLLVSGVLTKKMHFLLIYVSFLLV